jgi:ribosomal protein L24E
MSQRRCFLCGTKVRPGRGYRLAKLKAPDSDKVTESHLFCNAACGNVWMIWHGHHPRWAGIRWSIGRERKRKPGEFITFNTSFIHPLRALPKDYPEEYLWTLK